MALQFASIASGSNGNCYYLGNENEAILIDAGISYREIERRMKRMNLDILKIKAVFVSHEHSDHIRGIESLIKKFALPVYLNEKTYNACRFNLDAGSKMFFTNGDEINVGDLLITTFSKRHDAVDGCSFKISLNEYHVAVITDVGIACENVKRVFGECNAIILESNYDEEMLDKGLYPYHLKQRIKSHVGHLSNNQALELFTNYRTEKLSHLILGHLSQNNNSAQLVESIFTPYKNDLIIEVASRYHEGKVHTLSETLKSNQFIVKKGTQQLNLF